MFFIFGTPRSGTTILAQCLSSHADIVIPYETDFTVPLALLCDRVKTPDAGREIIYKVITEADCFKSSIYEFLSHNLETVPQLFKSIQPQSSFQASRYTLLNAKKLNPETLTKSGLLVGLGENLEEIKQTMQEIQSWDVDILTLDQYRQPSKNHLPVDRFYTPDEFKELKAFGLELGFKWVECAPLVRSSYQAAEQVRAIRTNQSA